MSDVVKRVGAVIERMESRYPEEVIATAVLVEFGRFELFNLAELQQLLASLTLAIRCRIFAPGPGNLLPKLVEELEGVLKEKAEVDEHVDSQ
jgi:hypothetical protein